MDNVKVAFSNETKYSAISGIMRLPSFWKEEKRIEEKAMELLSMFDLQSLVDVKARHLAYGKQRKLEIVRALASNPKVLLLDEPFSALDSYLRWEVEQQMREILEKERKPAIFVSHSRDEVFSVFNRVCCMSNGKTEETQPVKEFLHRPEQKQPQYFPAAKIYLICG